MLKFIIKRICASIPTMLVLITVSFFLMRLAPGSPFTGERNLPPRSWPTSEAKYHLNDPMYLQYFHYLKQLAQGDLGPSFKYKDFSVNELLAQSLPVSAELGFYAFLIAAIFGMFIGIIAALKQKQLAGLFADERRDDRHRRSQFCDGAGIGTGCLPSDCNGCLQAAGTMAH